MGVLYYCESGGDLRWSSVPDPERRLRKHNGELSGGAKYTRSKGPGWKHVCLVSGFQTKIQALQFEWAVKHCAPKMLEGLIVE